MLFRSATVTAAVGLRFYQADQAFDAFAASQRPSDTVRASRLMPWEPSYALEAGAATWRDAAAGHDAAGLAEGERLIDRGIARDPTGPLGYADLARLDMADGHIGRVPADLRAGLRRNPGDPSLEALWAYAALEVLSRRHDDALAATIFNGLRDWGPMSADAWYWLSAYYQRTGDTAAAEAAIARARALAPELTAQDYERRLLRAR